ncbi:hypothetical protein AB0933_21925 [Streptomyces venezuelae]|uniref:hypothetical protein n=1 Tax=Streptomyces venezuelae TaxID=54571 RepID=UPI003453465A
MRLRTVAASAALVLCTTAATAACSSSSDTADSTQPAGRTAPTKPASVDDMQGSIETGKRQAGPPATAGPDKANSAECATSAAEIPEECALDLSFSETTDGKPDTGAPAAQ